MADVYNFNKICRFCGGSGEEAEGVSCHVCDGVGRYKFGDVAEEEGVNYSFRMYKTCNYCGGSGQLENGVCPLCSGAGRYPWAELEEVT